MHCYVNSKCPVLRVVKGYNKASNKAGFMFTRVYVNCSLGKKRPILKDWSSLPPALRVKYIFLLRVGDAFRSNCRARPLGDHGSSDCWEMTCSPVFLTQTCCLIYQTLKSSRYRLSAQFISFSPINIRCAD